MNMCQRHGNESRGEGVGGGWAWERAISHKSSDQALSREGSDSSADIYPSLTDTDGLPDAHRTVHS